MAKDCTGNSSNNSTVLAQQLFLGASIVSFSSNIAWGGSSSSLTVDLANDFGSPGPCYITNSPNLDIFGTSPSRGGENHYYTCVGNDCYVDERGRAYDPEADPPSQEKRIPGKVYHILRENGLVSQYWRQHDPGFFGAGTYITPNGTFAPAGGQLYRYNLIGTPVYFRYGYFTFGGIIDAWDQEVDAGPGRFSVSVRSPESILENCHIILDKYAGSIFTFSSNNVGAPTNYIGDRGTYRGTLRQGSIPNVFNVYGFLESFGFGTSEKNDQGIPIRNIINALSVLTSSNSKDLGQKAAFSPFGRIIAPIPLTDDANPTNAIFGDRSFGLCDVVRDVNGTPRCEFLLDLSELPLPPPEIKLDNADTTISILDFIRQVCTKTNRDFYTIMVRKNGLNIIKIKTVNRTLPIASNNVTRIVSSLLQNGVAATRVSVGQDKSPAKPKVLIIGANQQRLYQTKSYLLGYSQANLIYHPAYNQFITLKDINKVKEPSVFSTRNVTLSQQVLGQATANIITQEQRAFAVPPDTQDTIFGDSEVGGTTQSIVGNYLETYKFDHSSAYSNPQVRYAPLYKNPIFPFFGYVSNETIDIDSTEGSNIYRFIRPVYYDVYTGQLAVALSLQELPPLSIGSMPPVYSIRENSGTQADSGTGAGMTGTVTGTASSTRQDEGGHFTDGFRLPANSNTNTSRRSTTRPIVGFLITESEMRAAMTGWESYLAYCLAKLNYSKPDLFIMLTDIYSRLGKILCNPQGVPQQSNDTGGNVLGPGTGIGSRTPLEDVNVAAAPGQKAANPRPAYQQLGINFNFTVDHEFIKDFRAIAEFVKTIGNNFYGKKYAIRLPELIAYKDRSNPDIKINAGGSNISVYQGSGKIFFNYEPSPDGAWEEIGNAIDGEIAIGSLNSYKLLNEQNLIDPILGFNANFNRDIVTERWCAFTQQKKFELLGSYYQAGRSEDETKKALIMEQLNKVGWNIENCNRRFIQSLDIGGLSEYLLTSVPGTPMDPYGNTLNGATRQKLYIKATINKTFAFLDPVNLYGPVAIMDAGDGIDLNSASHSYSNDPNRTVAATAAAEDLAFLEKARNGPLASYVRKFGFFGQNMTTARILLRKLIISMDQDSNLIPEGNTGNQASKFTTIAPKKAQPIFAGVPIKSNLACYGPWTNYPSLADQSFLFPGINNTQNLLEQFIDGVEIQQVDDYNPWTYGGMAFLDKTVFYEMDNYISYQTRLEQGSLTIPSLPVFGLAGNLNFRVTDSDWHTPQTDTFKGFTYSYLVYPPNNTNKRSPEYNDLTISNLSINVSNGNISTTYGFRTYSPKLGLLSKVNSDRIRELANNTSSVNRRIAKTAQGFENNLYKQINSLFESLKTERGTTDLSSFASKIYDASPSLLLIGQGTYYIPQTSKVISSTGMCNSFSQMFVADEATAELTKEFSSKAVSSMDGLFSPLSLYPTENNSTFAISTRAIVPSLRTKTITCPKCNGTGKYSAEIMMPGGGQTTIDLPCPLCSKSKPFGFDHATNKSEFSVEPNSEDIPINFITLNPIHLPTGEFRNENAQSGDGGRYNIRVVGRSEAHPTGNRSVDSFITINNHEIVAQNFGEIDLAYQSSRNIKILNNHRFFGFRGPMMLHGWGYDTDGYPVPNSADEPKELDSSNRPKRFFLTPSGTNDLTRDGAFLPVGNDQLGDIIGKGWEKENGNWTRKPTNKFYLNWGERSDLWPVGPIDLRWDYERKVWVAGGDGCSNADPPYIIASGNNSSILSQFISTTNSKKKSKCSYKMIYGVLEQNLTKLENSLETSPARAFLDDLEYGLKPLPENIRRLIYVVDRTGYTAPRGAKILLRYNTDTGFYEPVSKQQYIVYGMLNGNYTATVELSYMPGYKSGDYMYRDTISYRDPLNLESKSTVPGSRKGAFMYDNYGWNLIAIG